ncbi:FAD-dependent oxidoreductase [Sulfurimonas crateris]|uniref:FAD-dependent oxidoreductase n=1 Tax=Sulfurimonas crateris TaxID=2574727 RepID=A0A4V5TLW1_9BACT|nr:NAD(P)/FAD-dependent oxidoreductase [Sulfurimonas crateris]TKI69353.1 FAD-dependent oxidoreductase [Sulfurimonas crateris]
MKDFAVVGSGIGGSSIAALLSAKGYDVILFEKEPYLGGCSSSFSRGGYSYNTGATTFAGYEEGHIVKEIFELIDFKPDLIRTDPSIVVIQNEKTTLRYRDFDQFFEILHSNYPHAKNRAFWEMVYKINQEFYTFSGHYYANANIFSKTRSLLSFVPLFSKFKKYLLADAKSFIEDFFGIIDKEYFGFLESQVLIVAQAPLREINFFTAALSLAYTFNENYYVKGGFSTLFDGITKRVGEVHRKSEVRSIVRHSEYFELHLKDEVFKAKKVILNSTVYESGKLFSDSKIKDYYKKYEKLDNHQSSFMLYMTIKSERDFHHHYQIIQENQFPHTISKAVFVSFSDKEESRFAPKGYYSITASVHTDSRYWEDKESYKAKKRELEDILKALILEKLGIEKDEVVQSFGATSKTFDRYIKRAQLGGNAMTFKNFLPFLPGNDTPIKNLYNVGDTVFAAQGWPGVMLGVKNLQRLLGA